MDALKRKRGTLKASVTRIENFIKNVTNETEEVEIDVRLERLNELFKDFCVVQENIEESVAVEELTVEEAEREAMENKFFNIKVIGQMHLLRFPKTKVISAVSSDNNKQGDNIQKTTDVNTQNDLNNGDERLSTTQLAQQPQNTTVNRATVTSSVKLPTIDIPTFSGEYVEWPAFKDLYMALIHSSDQLLPSQKFHYLKSAMKGEALSLLRHLTISDANYIEAWNELCDRYDKPKYIINAHIKLIMEQPNIYSATSSNLKKMCNAISESVRALKALNLPVEHWDYWLNFIITNKLDSETKQLWARETAIKESPTFKELMNFLERRQFELESQSSKRSSQQATMSHKYQRDSTFKSVHSTMVSVNCLFCLENHTLYNCEKFKTTDIKTKREFIQKRGLCFNCLRPGHGVKKCTGSSCQICKRRHNTLLHVDSSQSNTRNISQSKVDMQDAVTTFSSQIKSGFNQLKNVLLPTAMVMVKDIMGQWQLCRALLDSGSQVTLISESCVQRLRIQRKHGKIPINGIGGSGVSTLSKGIVNIEVKSRHNNSSISATAVILNKLTKNVPEHKVKLDTTLENIQGLQLADPNCNQPGHIDIILGADNFFQIMLPGKIVSSSNEPIVQNTIFGWVIAGKITIEQRTISCHHTQIDLDQLLRQFWEQEEMTSDKPLTEEELECEKHFAETHERLPSGRYVIKLPFRKTNKLGDSKQAALNRLSAMEKRFAVNETLKLEYSNFMNEYLDLNHMREINSGELKNCQGNEFYLPHHAVHKPTSTTTKLRVVFDASSKSSSGVSLNDQLLVGPVIQSDLLTILGKFRLHKVAITADIAKMYRQIRLSEEDTKFHKIVWRKSIMEKIKEYELLTLTYGTATASYIATRVLHQLAMDECNDKSEIYNLLTKDFYMDDLMSGSEDAKHAIRLKNSLTEILHKGGFEIRKWSSNSEEFLKHIPESQRECSFPLVISSDEAIKTLGILWVPAKDCFTFKVKLNAIEYPTKRLVLSDIAKIFDPFGWLSPCIIKAKIIIQKLWLQGIGWDDELPQDLANQWLQYREELLKLQDLEIKRYIPTKGSRVLLCGFADASERAYAAVVYIVTITDNKSTTVKLVAAKTKVAPIQSISLPRLELCAAHLLAKLMVKVNEMLQIPNIELFAWSDSTIVLSWLAEHPAKWKTFIRNRTSYILSVLPAKFWNHIQSSQNPADCASRGIMPCDLFKHELWWNGPNIFREIESIDKLDYIHFMEENIDIVYKERRCDSLHITTSRTNDSDLLERYSDIFKLKRIIALCLRFGHNARNKKENRDTGFITTSELNAAFRVCIKIAQMEVYTQEIHNLKKGINIHKGSRLNSLNPFLDEHGILRVGGRLSEAELPYNQKFPIILPKNHVFTERLITQLHNKYLHAGASLLLCVIRQNYWIFGCRDVTRKIVHNCTICTRYRANTKSQQMGNLPKCRLQPGRTFANTGVDFAGPVTLKSWKGRGAKQYKGYIALFICLATKAIHLEVVSDLTSESFIATLKRFVTRRGLCNNLYCDNGTNFVGACRKLTEIATIWRTSEFQRKVTTALSELNITWHFIPPASPHFGGIWEAGVKSVKTHLYKVMGSAMLTFEEFSTLLCQIESCLNSRPLIPMDNSDESMEALTPAHFLIGSPIYSVPEISLEDTSLNRLTRWEYIQSLHQSFWKRWQNEYLSDQHQRSKWFFKETNIKPNTMVIIKDELLPPSHWLLGRIMETHPGKDGLVRVATVKTKNGIIKRPINKLSILSIN